LNVDGHEEEMGKSPLDRFVDELEARISNTAVNRQPSGSKPLVSQESKVDGKVDKPVNLEIGQRVRWLSPLFGDTSGIVAMPPSEGIVIVNEHEVTGGTVTIPLAWISCGHSGPR
jgi:hypothetical protein